MNLRSQWQHVSQRFLDTGEVSTFDASGSTDSPLDSQFIDTYVWDYGDDTSGSGAKTTHAYDRAGLYVVTLTVTDLARNYATTVSARNLCEHGTARRYFTQHAPRARGS